MARVVATTLAAQPEMSCVEGAQKALDQSNGSWLPSDRQPTTRGRGPPPPAPDASGSAPPPWPLEVGPGAEEEEEVTGRHAKERRPRSRASSCQSSGQPGGGKGEGGCGTVLCGPPLPTSPALTVEATGDGRWPAEQRTTTTQGGGQKRHMRCAPATIAARAPEPAQLHGMCVRCRCSQLEGRLRGGCQSP